MERKCNVAVLVICGLPGSGKTTLANALQTYIEKNSKQSCVAHHVCFDQILYDPNLHDTSEGLVGGSKNSQTWKEQRSQLMEKLSINIRAAKLEKRNHVFIVDDNMYYRSMRHQYFQVSQQEEIGYLQVFLECDFAECERRNLTRGHRIPLSTLESMSKKIESPRPETHRWEKRSIVLQSDKPLVCNHMEVIIDLLKDALNHSEELFKEDEEAKAIARETTRKNVAHQIDVQSRRIFKEWLTSQTSKGRDPRDLGKRGNAIRRNFVASILEREDALSQVILESLRMLLDAL